MSLKKTNLKISLKNPFQREIPKGFGRAGKGHGRVRQGQLGRQRVSQRAGKTAASLIN